MADYRSEFGQGGFNDRVDTEQLMENIGLDRKEIQWRKDYIDFDDSDVDRLTSYQDTFEENAETVAEMFYDNITEYEETTAVISRSNKGIEALKRTQQAYLQSLANGEYGREYFENRARIGKLHDILDMPMKYYIGQYGVYYNLLVPMILDQIEDEIEDIVEAWGQTMSTDGGSVSIDGNEDAVTFESPSPGLENLEDRLINAVEENVDDFYSMLKLINLDMQVVADTYIDSYTEDLQESLERQRRVADQVGGAITELRNSATDVADSADQIATLADEQSHDLEEVAGEVSNLSATVEEVASSADTVAERSQTAREQAQQGKERGEAVLDIMEDVNQSSEDVMDDVESLNDTVGEIDEVIEVINDVADQTNLLALNANIEAARADVEGSGFAVVADEIKALAEETQE
ncbi:MAG: protoglobin domain-containing protein, partial [Halanaeroarchaeum sp.]